jgi:anti-sigma-K factor RskA
MMMRKLDRGELLDRLPDFVHGTLPEDERVALEAALASDPSMARELDVVRRVHAALSAREVPRVDTDRVIAAIRRPAPMTARARAFGGVARWRVAAAIATLAVGGASLAVVKQQLGGTDRGTPYTVFGETTQVASAEPLSINFGYGLSDLAAEDLEKVMSELEKFDGLPAAEPQVRRAIVPVVEIKK